MHEGDTNMKQDCVGFKCNNYITQWIDLIDLINKQSFPYLQHYEHSWWFSPGTKANLCKRFF